MRILLDECVHSGVRKAFPGHSVKTVTEAGWRSCVDNVLLDYAQHSFDVFVTIDRKIEHQVNIEQFQIGIVMVHIRSYQLVDYLPLFPALLNAAHMVRPGKLLVVTALRI